QKEHIIRFREPFWKNIDLNGGEGSTADFFFSVYQENVKTEE
ncbi:MAG: peptidylprolyl isomerase, partial [Oribacterium sinus]|nr:peptidylprolyl isomerase [Oribacterium sinus]